MALELEKLMGWSKAAMTSDSQRFWKQDEHSCVFGCYPNTKCSFPKGWISLDQSSSVVLESFLVQHLPAAGHTWQRCCFPAAIQQRPALRPSSCTHFFLETWQVSECFIAPTSQTLDKPSLVWLSKDISLGTSAAQCTLNSALSRCGRNILGPHSASQQFAWADLHITALQCSKTHACCFQFPNSKAQNHF